MASPAGRRVNAVILAFTVVSGAVVFFRLFTRIAVIKNAGFEDVCIALAMVRALKLSAPTARQRMLILPIGLLNCPNCRHIRTS